MGRYFNEVLFALYRPFYINIVFCLFYPSLASLFILRLCIKCTCLVQFNTMQRKSLDHMQSKKSTHKQTLMFEAQHLSCKKHGVSFLSSFSQNKGIGHQTNTIYSFRAKDNFKQKTITHQCRTKENSADNTFKNYIHSSTLPSISSINGFQAKQQKVGSASFWTPQ